MPTRVHTYTCRLTVYDSFGNSRQTIVRRQPSAKLACDTAALQVLRNETIWSTEAHRMSEGLPPIPLLTRLRWQFQAMITLINE